jgi:hypothetical protein
MLNLCHSFQEPAKKKRVHQLVKNTSVEKEDNRLNKEMRSTQRALIR